MCVCVCVCMCVCGVCMCVLHICFICIRPQFRLLEKKRLCAQKRAWRVSIGCYSHINIGG